MRFGAFLAMMLVAAVPESPLPSPGPGASPHACVFASQWGESQGCAPFARSGIRIIRFIPNAAFGQDVKVRDLTVLADGTLLVRTSADGLFHIAGGRVTVVWRPQQRCAVPIKRPSLYELGDSWATALRSDGRSAFQLPPSRSVYRTVLQDNSGVVWALGDGSQPSLVAFFPRSGSVIAVDEPHGFVKLFLGPTGRAYVSNWSGLFALESRPTVRVRLVRGPIPDSGPIQAMGPDGSLWSSTPASVTHVLLTAP